MIDYKAITLSSKLSEEYGRDPFAICEAYDINIMERSDFVKQKGAFTVILGQMFIFLNANLSDQMKRIVVAHELGHAMLHKKAAMQGGAILEFELFDMRSTMESEANAFAANLLLDERDIVERIQEGMDVVQIARDLETNINLLLLKIQRMNEDGRYTIPKVPSRNFLGTCYDNAGYL